MTSQCTYRILDTAEVDGEPWFQIAVNSPLSRWLVETQSPGNYFISTSIGAVCVIDVSEHLLSLIQLIALETTVPYNIWDTIEI